MILRAVSMQAAMRCINSSVRRLEIFEEADDLGEQLARLPKARRHEQHQTGTLSGAPAGRSWRTRARTLWLSVDPARTRKSSDHFVFASGTNRTLGFSRFQSSPTILRRDVPC